MKKHFFLPFLAILSLATRLHAQAPVKDSLSRKFFIGSTLFVLSNLNTNDPNKPDFAQINLGYRFNTRNTVSLELKTWKYAWPLGIPYGGQLLAPEEKYPGFIRDVGFAFVYQHFWWKGLYTAIQAMNAQQMYFNEEKVKIRHGYQLFMTYRLGYQLNLFHQRFFIEPSVAVTHWPVKLNTPAGFKVQEDKWPRYFLFEPGFHFGFRL